MSQRFPMEKPPDSVYRTALGDILVGPLGVEPSTNGL